MLACVRMGLGLKLLWNYERKHVCQCETINLTATNKHELDRTQAKLLKVSLGLPKTARTSPLLQALRVIKVSDIINDNVLTLLKNIL